ncbi:MAG: NADH-quinone oxidoreductase subunit C [Phycisphaerae bacterium]
MNTDSHDIPDRLAAQFPDIDFAPGPLMPGRDRASAQMCVRIPAERLLEAMEFLRHDQQCCFEQLCDVTCVDYLDYPGARDRYGVIYSLLSVSTGRRLWVKCFVNDPSPVVPSVTGIWKGAEWLEREVYDLFGVRFEGHPDLRRIMTWEGFDAHPLRKDYPLRGRGERENFERVTRGSA